MLDIEMKVLGARKRFTHLVTEPEPGRVLVESDRDGSVATTFTVDPVEPGRSCRVTFETVFDVHDGIYGRIEQFLTAAMLRRIYLQELANLNAYVRSQNS